MYIPKETRSVINRKIARQRSKRSRFGIMLALLVLLSGAAWALWQADRKQPEATIAEQLLTHDLQTLWSWSDAQLTSGSAGAVWTIRWDLTANTGTMQGLVQKLFFDEKGNAAPKNVQNEGKTVTGVVQAYGGRLSISLMETISDSEQLMLLLETNQTLLPDKNKLLQAAASISGELARVAPAFTSSMKVQGYTANGQAIRDLMKQANAKSVDRFVEGGTISETLYTGMLRSSIIAGSGKSANLQIALHKETNSDKTALTIGIPVITGDYSVNTADKP
jgi:hypothetical protein